MTETKQGLQTGKSLFDFIVPEEVVVALESRLPITPHIISIGSGTPPNEPKELASFLGKNIEYTGIDNDSESVASGNRLAKSGWWDRGEQHTVNANFVEANLTKSLDEYMQTADLLVINHPDLLGSQDPDHSLFDDSPSPAWKLIIENSIRLAKAGGLIICTCYTEKERKLIEAYFAEYNAHIIHQQLHRFARISENYAIIFAETGKNNYC